MLKNPTSRTNGNIEPTRKEIERRAMHLMQKYRTVEVMGQGGVHTPGCLKATEPGLPPRNRR